MKYITHIDEASTFDELLAGPEQAVSVINVEVDSGTEITRGTILAGEVGGKFAPLTSADTSKSLIIAADNFDSDSTVISAYSQGKFHRERLIYDENIDLNDFETELRRQNIILTTLKMQ